MLFPLAVSFIYGDGDYLAFAWSILILLATGALLSLFKTKNKNFNTKGAFAAAALSWLLFSIFGALPYYFSGHFNSFIDCIFESVSGFTTTGASVLINIEAMPKSILFWRSFSQWIGGMGVLVFMLAVMPSVNASSVNLLRAETTGPSPDKIVPKIREAAKIMYLMYVTMTAVLVVLLNIAGLPFYDSLVHAFSTAGTGGFSNMNASVGAYSSPIVEIIIMVFMFLFGISFSLYFILLGRHFKRFIRDEELKIYFGLLITAIMVITINIAGMYGGFWEALKHSSFHAVSIMTTTGFTTADYNLWPALSQAVLVILMITGSCAGSTSGGIKLIRILIILKMAKIELSKILHPGSVKAVSINDKKIGGEVVSKTASFFFIYSAIFLVAVILVSIEGQDLLSNITAVIASLSNIGPGLGAIGPAENYSMLTPVSKTVLSFCMIAGRLEFFPVLILLAPSVWKRGV